MTLEVVQWDDSWLRVKAEEKTELTSEVKKFIQDLLDLMNGPKLYTPTSRPVGLAATQVASSHRIFSVCPYSEVNGHESFGAPKIFMNPVLSEPSLETEIEDEGCLSFPGLYIPVERPIAITVEYQDENGVSHKERLEGHYARQVMHENDHLNGVLYIDRTSKTIRKRIKHRLDQIKKQYKKNKKK